MPDCHLHALPYHESPCERFALVRQAPGAVLLDAGRPVAERGRYDLFSAWPLAELAAMPGESATDFAQRLRKALASLGDQRAKHSILRGLSALLRDTRTLSVVAAGRAKLPEALPIISAMQGDAARGRAARSPRAARSRA